MSQVVERQPDAYRALCDSLRSAGKTLAFVPTMGALHEGHLALMREGKRRESALAVSIFVNPTQFGPNEDYQRYPRDLDGDLRACSSVGVDIVFCPDAEALYASGEQTRVKVGSLAAGLCGASRPGHFDGVATVVLKLLNLTGPCTAIFGRKDYQQLRVIERMAADLFPPVRIVGHPIVREADGLALSSRNRYLSDAQRQAARAIPQALTLAADLLTRGQRRADEILSAVQRHLQAAELRVDYVALVDAADLRPVSAIPPAGRALLALAVFAGSTRLIDNIVLGEEEPPTGS